ncbi:NADH:ubiquinone oxidoreductase complex I intermediate-associated protein 30 [Ascobolus immersus RN42]|uniref:NADH:ubiquinone oxidoreductase complex I intermediate-associated protein 30 n=1 Tax=Ascobolus immersus RN42 TaxID=1160509 RepID=A0A3N4I6B0_ASCIM|nr:NADH:ubiquinone oxidoreductase complex I intermediate-associated protein 30 [Ascobolus immersus RN42]
MWITKLYPPFTPPWVPQTDQLRGGSSTAHCKINPSTGSMTFSGTLDTQTLGGAGFTSLITPSPIDLNLYDADGLYLNILRVEGGMMYSFVIKNAIPEETSDEQREAQRLRYGEKEGKKGNGRSTVSFEARFLPTKTGQMRIGWECFKPYYRGRKVEPTPERPEVPKMDLVNVRRMGIMVRSFFGKQDGSFVVEVGEIGTYAGDEGQLFGGCCVV